MLRTLAQGLVSLIIFSFFSGFFKRMIKCRRLLLYLFGKDIDCKNKMGFIDFQIGIFPKRLLSRFNVNNFFIFEECS